MRCIQAQVVEYRKGPLYLRHLLRTRGKINLEFVKVMNKDMNN